MQIFYHDQHPLPLPEGHRFPLPKYTLLRQRIIEEGLVSPEQLQAGPEATDEQILRVHTQEYLNKVKNGTLTKQEIRRIGFPWSPELVERSLRSVGSTIAACRAAVQGGFGLNLAGGTHHAGPDFGQGFCVFNDSAAAGRAMQAEGLAKRVIILDCDVHQGNGTAAIFAGDESVYTFSIHGANNFPFHKIPGDLDVPLPDGTDDEIYLEALEEGLERALPEARADLAIYLAGADPHTNDRLGRLAVSRQGLAERDRMVMEACHSAGLPVAIAMAGGYGRRIEETVNIHFHTVEIAAGLARSGQ